MLKYIVDLKYFFIGFICGSGMIFMGIKTKKIERKYTSSITTMLFILTVVFIKGFFSLEEPLWDLIFGLASGIVGAKFKSKH